MQVIDSDFSALEGTNCYCSADSAEQIRRKIAQMPEKAVHLIGTGDYHYITLFWLEKIRVPFVLVLFDNHPDDMPAAFGSELLSCGSWVCDARRLPLLREVLWIRSDEDAERLLKDIRYPVYLSIDLDVLSTRYARTDWDQGEMELGMLISHIRGLSDILGVDICGGLAPEKGGTEADEAVNSGTVRALTEIFTR